MNTSRSENKKDLQIDFKENQLLEYQDLLHRNFKYFSYIIFSNKLVEYNSLKHESIESVEDCIPEFVNGCHLDFANEVESEKEDYFHVHTEDLNQIISNLHIEITNIHPNNLDFQQFGYFDI
jgi:hypothetical protein